MTNRKLNKTSKSNRLTKTGTGQLKPGTPVTKMHNVKTKSEANIAMVDHLVRESIAYHEAGHAVAHYLLKIPFEYVKIESFENGSTFGYVQLPYPQGLATLIAVSRRQHDHHVMIKLAGEATSRIRMGDFCVEVPESDDLKKARNLISNAFEKPDEEGDVYIEKMKVRTEQWLSETEHWAMVSEVAEALLVYEKLSYREALRIMKEAAALAKTEPDLFANKRNWYLTGSYVSISSSVSSNHISGQQQSV